MPAPLGTTAPLGMPARATAAEPVRGSRAGAGSDFGVYVHVPFCVHRCDYCAFATWESKGHLMERYASSCRAEIAGARLPGVDQGPVLPHAATSVFFGGGTPSLMAPELLISILSAVEPRAGAEVTVECNPETVSRALLEDYRAAGVTRLSFGVQSMVPAVLASLGRRHDPDAVRTAAEAAGAAGFADSYSVDLIYGAAGESISDWRRSLEGVLGLHPPPTHVSAYALTVEPGTPLANQPRRHPDPDDQADKYIVADEVLSAAGFSWYEVSNWSKPSAECRHNQLYWSQGEYRGFGCSAHSHAVDGAHARRWWNVRTPERYIDLIGAGRSPVAAGEELDRDQRRLERLQLSLRTAAGVAIEDLGHVDRLDAQLDSLYAAGLISVGDGAVTLTRKGRLLANEAIMRLSDPCTPAA